MSSSPLRRQGPSDFVRAIPQLRHAPPSRGIHAVFHSPPASESLSLAWPRESNQREGHPDAAVSKHSATAPALHSTAFSRRGSTASIHGCVPPASMQSPAFRLRNATPGVRRQSIPGLTSNWALSIAPTLRAFPPLRCRCIGGPFTAHPATAPALLYLGYPYPRLRSQDKAASGTLRVAFESPSPASREKVPGRADEGLWLWLWLGRARRALLGSPRSRRDCEGQVRRMAHTMWASSTSVHGWTVGEPRSRLANLEHRDCA